MPGHVKLGKAGEPDPDPMPYLVVSMETKREDQNRPYDAKKSYWCKNEKGDFKECMLEEGGEPGGKATVMMGHEVCTFENLNLIYLSFANNILRSLYIVNQYRFLLL